MGRVDLICTMHDTNLAFLLGYIRYGNTVSVPGYRKKYIYIKNPKSERNKLVCIFISYVH